MGAMRSVRIVSRPRNRYRTIAIATMVPATVADSVVQTARCRVVPSEVVSSRVLKKLTYQRSEKPWGGNTRY